MITKDNIAIPDNVNIEKLIKLYTDNISEQEELRYLIDIYDSSSDIFQDEKVQDLINSEIVSIHLNDVYSVLGNISEQSDIFKRLEQIYRLFGLPTDGLKITYELEKEITVQHLSASKTFKEKKGTKSGFFFVYDLIKKSGIQFSEKDFLEIEEGTEINPKEPYVYRVNTSLYKEVYDKTILPLSHPIGFAYLFSRLLSIVFLDNYNIKENTDLISLSITCYYQINGVTSHDTIDALDGRFGVFDGIMVTDDDDPTISEKVVVDYFSLINPGINGYRIVRSFDNRIVIYNREDNYIIPDTSLFTNDEVLEFNDNNYVGEEILLEITDVKLFDETNGILINSFSDKTITGETFSVLDSISFQGYTLQENVELVLLFKIKGDLDVWNTSRIPLENLIISGNKSLYSEVIFNRKDIIDGSVNYNGRIIKDKKFDCQFNYLLENTFISALEEDIHDTIVSVSGDEWTDRGDFKGNAFIIGRYIRDPLRDPSDIIPPHVGEKDTVGNTYKIGYDSAILQRMNYLAEVFGVDEDILKINAYAPKYKRLDESQLISYGTYIENSESVAWEDKATTIISKNNQNPIINYSSPWVIGGFYEDTGDKIVIGYDLTHNDKISTVDNISYVTMVEAETVNMLYYTQENYDVGVFRDGELLANNNITSLP